jgi:hypothetical protein
VTVLLLNPSVLETRVDGADDCLPLSVLGVSDRVTNDVLEEDLEDTAGFFVDETRDTLDTTTARETTDGGFGDTLMMVPRLDWKVRAG